MRIHIFSIEVFNSVIAQTGESEATVSVSTPITLVSSGRASRRDRFTTEMHNFLIYEQREITATETVQS